MALKLRLRLVQKVFLVIRWGDALSAASGAVGDLRLGAGAWDKRSAEGRAPTSLPMVGPNGCAKRFRIGGAKAGIYKRWPLARSQTNGRFLRAGLMRYFLITLLVIQSLAVTALFVFLGLILLFWDAPSTYPSIWLITLGGLALGFPILAVLAIILQGRSHYYLLLPLASTMPALFIVLGLNSGAMQSAKGGPAPGPTAAQVANDYLSKRQLAEPDFVCADGTFFSFNPDLKSELLYFPAATEFIDPTRPADQHPPWKIGHLDENHPDQFLISTSENLSYWSSEGVGALIKKLGESQGKDGRTFQETYPYR